LPFEQLALPLCDLVRMDIEFLSQFGERAIALNGGQRYLGLEDR
jgi:hypothetical protein